MINSLVVEESESANKRLQKTPVKSVKRIFFPLRTVRYISMIKLSIQNKTKNKFGIVKKRSRQGKQLGCRGER